MKNKRKMSNDNLPLESFPALNSTVAGLETVDPSFFTGQYTHQWDKYSCVRDAYFVHIAFAYMIMLTGLGCFLSRIGPSKLKWTHRWFGRAYIISMVWCLATSLMIHNNGLPLAVLWSFLWVLLFMSLGWVIIVLHMNKMEKLAMMKIESEIAKGSSPANLQAQIMRAKGSIAQAKTFKERMFSYKAVHGIMMFTSWINITGRIFASNQSGDFQCYTYTVYKPLVGNSHSHGDFSTSPVTLMPGADPNYMKLPWAKMGEASWAVALSIGPLAGAFVFGLIYTAIATRNNKLVDDNSSGASSGPQVGLIASFKRKLGFAPKEANANEQIGNS